jgi:hypothetical protein
MICTHRADQLGWLPSGSWGCKFCGWVAPISALKPTPWPWYKRHSRLILAVAFILWIATLVLLYLLSP